MLVRDKFKLAWLTFNGFKWSRIQTSETGTFEYIFDGTKDEKECLRQYGSNDAMSVKELKEELQLNQYRSQESITNERKNNININ
ncbi:MAG: hypothetical protein LCH52_16450 [Bacteroidetes bacterium]|nr:hypothetical protein [Bacteroidota bacterium]